MKRIFLASLLVVTLLSPSLASAQTTAELTALIQSLLSQIATLQAKLGAQGGNSVGTSGSPTPVTVTARELKVRTSPYTSSPRVLSAYNGEKVSVVEKVLGESVEGNNVWYKTRSGYFVWSGGSTAPVFITNNTNVQNTYVPPATNVTVNVPAQTTPLQTVPTSVTCVYPTPQTGYHYEGSDTSTTCGKVLVKDATTNTNTNTQTITQQTSTTPAQRDAQRGSDLKAVQTALEAYAAKFGTYPVSSKGMTLFYSAWSGHNGTWGWGNPPDTALYDALVKNGFLSSLPNDPINKSNYATNAFLSTGPTNDLGYIYYSPDGKQYVLGANAETLPQHLSVFGSTQLVGNLYAKIPIPSSLGTAQSRDLQRKADLQNVATALKQYKNKTGSYPFSTKTAGDFFSVWYFRGDKWEYKPVSWGYYPYPGNGTGPIDTTLYDALVGGGHISALPLDPINAQYYTYGSKGNLGEGSPTTLGYIYHSTDGSTYILGTNMEDPSNANTSVGTYGNYQITP